MRRRIRAYIIAFSALFMAGCAAFFSVTGVGQLAAGAGISVILLVSALEVGKLVTASFAHRRWANINFLQKSFAVFGVAVAMLITSIGIFGQLISGYTTTSAEFQIGTQSIQIKESEKEFVKSRIVRIDDLIERKNKRSNDLVNLRIQQENRIDSLQARNAWRSAREARELIDRADSEIQILNQEIDSLNLFVSDLYNDISKIDSSIIYMSGDLYQGKAAPLKMIADMAGIEMDSATKFFFGFFVLIFDPFAILLVIFFNIEIQIARREEEEQNSLMLEKVSSKQEDEEDSTQSHYISNNQGDFVPKEKLEDEFLDEEGEYEEKDVDEDDYLLEQIGEDLRTTDYEEQEENKKTVYQKLLSILFIDGKIKKGQNIYTFKDFLSAIRKEGLDIQEDVIVEFLKVCAILKIIQIDKENRKALMDYDSANFLIERMDT